MQLPTGMRWWSFVLRGVIAILFGVIAFLQPGITLASLIVVFAVYAFVDGVFAIAAGLASPSKPNWGLLAVGGLGVIAGVIAFISPGLTALTLLTLIGVWAIFTGVSEIIAAYRLRKSINNEWLLIVSGVISAAFGAYVLAVPGEGAVAVVWLIGWYAILAGVMYLALGFRLRGVHESVQQMTGIPAR